MERGAAGRGGRPLDNVRASDALPLILPSPAQGQEWVFEAAVRDCFGTIDHPDAEAHDRRNIALPPPLTPGPTLEP